MEKKVLYFRKSIINTKESIIFKESIKNIKKYKNIKTLHFSSDLNDFSGEKNKKEILRI